MRNLNSSDLTVFYNAIAFLLNTITQAEQQLASLSYCTEFSVGSTTCTKFILLSMP